MSVQGYKSIGEEQRFEIRPLTILAGANSSGKTSIMQPLLLLKQTLEAPFDPGALFLDGPNVSVTAAEQILSSMGSEQASGFRVDLEVESSVSTLEFVRVPKQGFDLLSVAYGDSEEGYSLRAGMTADQVLSVLPRQIIDRYLLGKQGSLSIVGVARLRCFLGMELEVPGSPRESSFWVSPSPLFQPAIESLIHLPGLRGNPERTYQRTATGDTFPGVFQDYMASLVADWQAARDDRLALLGTTLRQLGLTWKIEARAVDDTRVELRVGRLPRPRQGGAKDLVSVADVGFGVSQVLPVVVALLVAEPGQMVYVEQPEIHLHPRAQVQLARVLADAARRGVYVIAETHSSLLMQEVQTQVAKGELTPDQVRLHWFERRTKDGMTQVTTADLHADGSYGDWPVDFEDVSFKSSKSYLDAASEVAWRSSASNGDT